MCPDYEISPVGDANGNLQQISFSVIFRVRFGNAFYKTIFSVADYFNMEVLIGTRFMQYHVKSIRWNDQHVEITKSRIRSLKTLLTSLLWKDWNLWKVTTADQIRSHQLKRCTTILISCVIKLPCMSTSPYPLYTSLGKGGDLNI